MKRILTTFTALAIAVAISGCAHQAQSNSHSRAASGGFESTALDDYVYTPDSNYEYEVIEAIQGKGYKGYVIRMVSQQYLTAEEISEPIWWHWLRVVVPANATSGTGLMYIGGGNNSSDAPTDIDGAFAQLAMGANTVVAQLHMVPNQPLTFLDDPDAAARKEDSLIAYTWDKFLRTGDEKWPLRLPMTKSAVAAMDTVQDLLKESDHAIDEFVVAGGSKRGWTTWTTAAVDNRVSAIVPIVIDLLNTEESFKHHWEVYGFWAPAVGDYVERDLMSWMGSPENNALYGLVEPFSYRERYDMPKLMINATGDQFFLPDSSQFYFDELVGEKHLRYVPNGDHGLDETDAFETLLSFLHSVAHDVERPSFTWEIQEDNSIKVWTVDKPAQVNLWWASNPDTRDFRKDTIGAAWKSKELEDQGNGVFVGSVEEPAKGWNAFTVELVYPSGASVPFKFTTEVHVVPTTLPFKYEAPEWPKGGYIRGNN